MSDTDQPPLPEWGPGKTAMGRARLPSSRRRDRPTLSCNLCRRRKLRCDRQQPCATCAHRGLDLSCSYAYGPNARSNLGDDVPAPPSPATVQDRIKQLELLVVDLMQKTSATDSTYKPRLTPTSLLAANESAESTCNPATDDSLDRFTPDADHGSMRLTMSGTRYVHGAHWTAVLDGIAELKDHFEREDEGQPERRSTEHLVTDWTGPQLLYGFTKLATREEILASIPARTVVDRLVSRYFNSFDMSPAVLHSVQFLKEYHAFWEDASGTSTIWLGLLFSVMCLATQFQRFQLDPHDQPSAMSVEQDLGDMVDSFRQRIVQCLILGNYAKGGRYVLETLLLYMTVELFLRSDAEIGIWMLLGTIVQLAMHMGYHRDPKHFRRISPFDGEMRKRVWATVVEVQLGVSMQMGLPRLISQWQTDTSEPSNLQDSDFNMDTVVMPPSRPETDLTPMIYRVVKARMMMTIGYIWDFAAGTGSYTHADVLKMEQTLQDAHASIPECLAWRSMADCITDSPHIIMQKVYLEILFHRARIVLHRRCLHLSPSKLQYSHSQGSYLDAALRLLEYQHMLWEETQPPCQLYQERWKVSSLVNHDFLLATSVLCLYLKQSSRQGHMNSEAPTVGTIWASLERSYDIWLQSSGTSKEAAKAAKALRVVLLRPGPGIDDSTPLGRDSSSSSIAASDFGERFGGHYDVDFDTAMMGDWPFPTGEPIGSSFVTLSTSPGVGWQMADGAETTSSRP